MPIRSPKGLVPWPAVMIVWGPGFKTAAHRHHCVQLLLALHGSLRIRGGRTKAWTKCGAVWVRPDATHAVDARGTTLLLAASITTAAHRAGFSDAAHLTRTFRRMLGATPSALALLKRLSLGFSFAAEEPAGRARTGVA